MAEEEEVEKVQWHGYAGGGAAPFVDFELVLSPSPLSIVLE